MASDLGRLYRPPHWLDLNLDAEILPTAPCDPPADPERERAFPMVYARGECPLVRVRLEFPDLPSRQCVRVRGIARGAERMVFEARADVTPHPSPRPGFPNAGLLDTGLMAPSVGLRETIGAYDPLVIDWEVALLRDPGPDDWVSAGQTRNRVYVTHGTARPDFYSSQPRETVLHLACKAAEGRTSEDAIMDAIWREFEDPAGAPEVRRKPVDGYGWADGAVLRFWGSEMAGTPPPYVESPELCFVETYCQTLPAMMDPCAHVVAVPTCEPAIATADERPVPTVPARARLGRTSCLARCCRCLACRRRVSRIRGAGSGTTSSSSGDRMSWIHRRGSHA